MEKEAECANHPSRISIANPSGLRIFFLCLFLRRDLCVAKETDTERLA